MAYSLVLLNGPTPGAGVTLDPARGPVTIGRDAARELPMDDDLCSRLHARIWFEADRWHLEDCGSRNGTLLNGNPVTRDMLQSGDVIGIGERLMVFVDDDPAADGPGLRSSQLAASTKVLRVPEPSKREAFVEQLREQAATRPMRDAALLCRLAAQLPTVPQAGALLKLLTASLTEAIGPDLVLVYLVGSDGRLRCVARSDGEKPAAARPHVLASLALVNNEALLVPEGSEWSSTIGVPIPGQSARRGAVECHRATGKPAFEQADLDVAIAIVHQVGMALENLEHRERLELANDQLRAAAAEQNRLIGDSAAMRGLVDAIGRAAPTQATVLIRGESGTGKELVAQTIHELSSRRAGACVAVNCAAFSETLLESELFGHERGAFTGADRRRIGQFERAHRGTLFLDEVGEMSPACQAKLLRVLEGHAFERLGGTEPIRVDVRIVAATHRNLPELVAGGRFRQDLYYRLRVIELEVPPLRERGDDCLTLAAHYLEHFRRQVGRGAARLSESAAKLIRGYGWPGNVRELKNAIERAVVLGQSDEVLPEDLGLAPDPSGRPAEGALVSLEEAERRHIEYVLRQVGGNKTRACEILEIGRGTLYNKLGRSGDEGE